MTCKNNASIIDYGATRSIISEIDMKSEKLKKKILESKSSYKVKGKVYYVSPKGCDSNDGLSPDTAWKTLRRMSNAPELCAGDVVLLERGQMFRGNSIRCVEGVTYSAYGEGAKPIINCSPEDGTGASKWKKLSGTDNIWVYKTKFFDVGNLIFDGGAYCGLKQVPDWKHGEFCVRDTNGEEVFDVRKHLTKNFQFFCECNKVLFNGKYPLSEHPKNLGTLYLYCDMGNPGAVFSSIEFALRLSGLICADGVTVDNLCLLYAGVHGICAGTCKNFTVRNCEVGFIGGGIHFYNNDRAVRLGNGIQIYGGCKNYLVENNYIYECYDAGATHQYSRGGTDDITMINAVYRNNLIEKCVYSIEYFVNIPFSGLDRKRFMKHTRIVNNIMRYCGFGFGMQRHDKENPAHIKTWRAKNESTDYIIENNIFDRSRASMVCSTAYEARWLPEYRNNIFIQYNTLDTANFGKYAEGDDKRDPAVMPYDETIEGKLNELGFKNNEFYFAEIDEYCDIPHMA